MSDSDLFDAVAQKTGEDSHEIRRRGFVLTGPDDTGPEPECLLDVMLVDLPESGMVDWDALGFGCREASNLIDELKGDEPTTSPSTNSHANGNGSYATTGGAR